jgi:uncharacterized protein
MPQSMSQASIPVFVTGLTALSKVLEKAEAFVAEKKIDPAQFLHARLAPDMFDFTRQVQTVTDHARRGGARLAGVEPPKYEDNETSLAELKTRLAKTIAFLKTLDSGAIDAAGERTITIPLGGNSGEMKGSDYLNYFLLPNYYFHLTTAYDLARHAGVQVGKRDFLGAIPLTLKSA